MISFKCTAAIVMLTFVIILSGCGQPINTNSGSSSAQNSTTPTEQLSSSSFISENSSSNSLIPSDSTSFSASIVSPAPAVGKTRFDSLLNKISDEIIYGPAHFHEGKIIYSNGFSPDEKNLFLDSEIKKTSYGILYPNTKTLDKHMIASVFNDLHITESAIWFTFFSYEAQRPDTSIMYDIKIDRFKEIRYDTSPDFIKAKNDRYLWIFKGFDLGIDQVDKNGKIINYFFSDIIEKNYINKFYITSNCLWTDWGGEGSNAGVSYLDFKTMRWHHFLGYVDEDALKNKMDPVLNDYRGLVWVDYNSDLYALCVYDNVDNIVRYNYAKKSWEVFLTAKENTYLFESDLTFFEDFVILNSGEKVEIINKTSKELEKTYMTGYKTYKVLTDEKNSTIYFMTDKGVFSQKITK